MRLIHRRRNSALLVVALVVVFAMGASLASIGGASPKPLHTSAAHIAKRKTVTLTEHARMHLIKKKGGILRESGTTTGTLAGKVSGRFNISNIAKPTGTVTFKPNGGGSITVTAVGIPDSLGTVARFHGNIAVRGGSGRYDQVIGKGPGTFTGTVNRDNWDITVDATVKITY
jgi:hypothetical protein